MLDHSSHVESEPDFPASLTSTPSANLLNTQLGIFGLMFYAYQPECRRLITEKGGIELVEELLTKYRDDKDTVKEVRLTPFTSSRLHSPHR